MEQGVFDKDPVFAHPRDSRGRYCTEDRAEYERVKRENKYLRLQVEKYKRQAEQSNDVFIALLKDLKNFKNKENQ